MVAAPVTVMSPGNTPMSGTSVVVRYRSPTDVPLIGVFLGDITVTGAATMQVEP